jgi:hypothetical protein
MTIFGRSGEVLADVVGFALGRRFEVVPLGRGGHLNIHVNCQLYSNELGVVNHRVE